MFDDTTFNYIIIPILIFCARIIDVTLGTIRIIFVSKGMSYIAPVLGFFEVLIWLLAIGQIMQHLTHVVNYIAYAAGFATGNFVGIYIENKLSVGNLVFRIITDHNAPELINALKDSRFGVTYIEGHGIFGPVQVLFTIVRRRDLNAVVKIIREKVPDAFYSIEDVRFVRDLLPPAVDNYIKWHYLKPTRIFRKSK
jgi:uncharacterized protein YebE (UPF0316 family)